MDTHQSQQFIARQLEWYEQSSKIDKYDPNRAEKLAIQNRMPRREVKISRAVDKGKVQIRNEAHHYGKRCEGHAYNEVKI